MLPSTLSASRDVGGKRTPAPKDRRGPDQSPQGVRRRQHRERARERKPTGNNKGFGWNTFASIATRCRSCSCTRRSNSDSPTSDDDPYSTQQLHRSGPMLCHRHFASSPMEPLAVADEFGEPPRYSLVASGNWDAEGIDATAYRRAVSSGSGWKPLHQARCDTNLVERCFGTPHHRHEIREIEPTSPREEHLHLDSPSCLWERHQAGTHCRCRHINRV